MMQARWDVADEVRVEIEAKVKSLQSCFAWQILFSQHFGNLTIEQTYCYIQRPKKKSIERHNWEGGKLTSSVFV